MIIYCRDNGYTDSFWYHVGAMEGDNFNGWTGNLTLDFETFIDSTTTMKRNFSAPKVTLKFKRNWEYIYTDVKTEFLKPMYPVGQCLKVIYPDESENLSLSGIIIETAKTKTNEEDADADNSLIIHLRDKNAGF